MNARDRQELALQVAVDRWMAEHGVLDFPAYQCVDCGDWFNRRDPVCACQADVRMVHEEEIRTEVAIELEERAEAQADAHIDHLIDVARGH